MFITLPKEYQEARQAKVGDVLTFKGKVVELTNTGIICDVIQPVPPAKKGTVMDYLKSVNKKPITPTPKLPI